MVAAALLSVSYAAPARAANVFWDANGSVAGLGGAGIWNATSGTTWLDVGTATTAIGTETPADFTFSNNSIAYFAGTAGEVDLGSNVTVGGLVFQTTGYDIVGAGNTLTLAAPTGAFAPAISVSLAQSARLSTQLAGTSGFVKIGDGTLVLGNAANTFTGDIGIRAGTLVVTNAGQLGLGTTAISVTGWAQTGNPGFSSGALLLQGVVNTDLSLSASQAGITINRQVTVSGDGATPVNYGGSLISVGYNTLAGGLVFGANFTESRIWSAYGATTISGQLQIGTTQSNNFNGNGNWIISGLVTGTENANSRFIKLGALITTTLWLQNAANNMYQSINVSGGTVRVSNNGALGNNTGTAMLTLTNSGVE